MKRSSASSHEQSVLMFRNNLIEDGWKFDPPNEKLISKHLKPKILGEYKGDKEVIGEIDICKFEPCDLPGLSKLKSDDQVWFFLCPRHFCGTSRRSKRRTKAGYWKPTGQVRWIKDTRTKREIGTKKTLVFYKKASPKDLRTRWTIYEYEYLPEPNLNIQREFVLIRLEKKAEDKVKNQTASDVQKHANQSVQNQTPFAAQNQATSNVLNQDNQNNYGQNAYLGEQSCHTSSKFQAHNSGAPMVNNSADKQSEVSHNMVYLDNTKQFPNELIPISDGCSMAFDSINQNPTKSVALSTIESLPVSDFRNENSTFELKDGRIPYMGTPPDPSGLLASISSYQSLRFKDYPNFPMASISSIAQYKSPYYNTYSSDPIGSISQYQDKEADMSASIVPTPPPTPYDNNGVRCPRDSGLAYQPPYGHGESSSLKATDNENQNKDKNVNVSASQESEKNSSVAASLDSESQNACMSDLLVAGGNYWSPLMTSLSENDAQGGIVLTEEQSQLLRADWEAFLELKNCLNSKEVLQGTCTEEVANLQ